MTPGYLAPETFVKHLSEHGFRRRRPTESHGELNVHALDLTPLRLSAGYFVPFVTMPSLAARERVTASELERLASALIEYARGSSEDFVVVVLGGEATEDAQGLLRRLAGFNIAVIDARVCRAVYDAGDLAQKERALCEGLVQRLGRDALSPYMAGRPALGGRFFGRSRDLNQVLAGRHGNNYTILGNRRIGKTSFLQQVRSQLSTENRDLRTAYIYGAMYHSTEEVVGTILSELGSPGAERRAADPVGARTLIREFPSRVDGISDRGRVPVAVFIDEVDPLLDMDALQNYELLNVLRAAFERRAQCRVFFAGFRRLMEERDNMLSPLYNFTYPIHLSALTREEAVTMVTGPLGRLGLDVAATELPAIIYRETAGHPELIQIYCAELISWVKQHTQLPSAHDLLSVVAMSEVFEQKVLGAFLANTNAYEQLVCYLLIREAQLSETSMDQYEFEAGAVDRVLDAIGVPPSIQQIRRTLKQLSIAGVMTPVSGGKRHRFAVPQLAAYCESLDLDLSIGKALKEVRSAGSAAAALSQEAASVGVFRGRRHG